MSENIDTICPICLENELTHLSDNNEIMYKGKLLLVDFEYSNCIQCGDMGLQDQIRRNDCRAQDARIKADLEKKRR